MPYVDGVFNLADLTAFSKDLSSVILSCQDLSIPRGKKTPLEISRRASLVPSKMSTYLVVLHSKWFTWFSYLNNFLLAFDYEEVACINLTK